jgi:hypothetical protein
MPDDDQLAEFRTMAFLKIGQRESKKQRLMTLPKILVK